MKKVDKAINSAYDLRETATDCASSASISGVNWYSSNEGFNKENAKYRRAKKARLKNGIVARSSEEQKANKKNESKLSNLPSNDKPRQGIDSGYGLANGVMLGSVGNFEALRLNPQTEDKEIYIPVRIGLQSKAIICAVKFVSGYRLDKEELNIIEDANKQGLFDNDLSSFRNAGLLEEINENTGEIIEKYSSEIISAIKQLIFEEGFFVSEKENKARKAKGYSFFHSSKALNVGLRINPLTKIQKELTPQQKERIAKHKEAKKKNLIPNVHNLEISNQVNRARIFINSTGLINSKLLFLIENIAISKATESDRLSRIKAAIDNHILDYINSSGDKAELSEAQKAVIVKEHKKALESLQEKQEKRKARRESIKYNPLPKESFLNERAFQSAYVAELMPTCKAEKVEACPVSQNAFELAQIELTEEIARKKEAARILKKEMRNLEHKKTQAEKRKEKRKEKRRLLKSKK